MNTLFDASHPLLGDLYDPSRPLPIIMAPPLDADPTLGNCGPLWVYTAEELMPGPQEEMKVDPFTQKIIYPTNM